MKIKSKELGFGTFASERGQRFMNPDGSANVKRFGGPLFSASDIFHRLVQMKWRKFFLVILIGYTSANILFAIGYYAAGVRDIGMEPSGKVWKDFMECFFFSTQCFTTIGFGRVNPQGMLTNIIASVEGLTGLLSFAMATGLLYGRFSRPRAHLFRSKNILVSPYRKDQRGLMFRIASTRRHSMLVDNSVSVSMGINQLENGHYSRRFYQLNLELDRINFLATSWTLVHPINEDSPLWGKTYEDLVGGRTEFIVLFRAMEETTSQITLERFSYFVDELIWAAKFEPMIGTTEEGQAMLNLNYISNWQPAELPGEMPGPRPAAAIG